MHVLALQSAAESAGQVESIASTFGVDWPHLGAQIVSFVIVCGVLYALAYKPILRMLEARRQQIASGLANAEKIKAELARIESERLDVLKKADAEGKQLIEEARAAAARVQAEETQKAIASGEQILDQSPRNRRTRPRPHARRAQTGSRTARRADDGHRHGQDSDGGGSPSTRRGDGAAPCVVKRRMGNGRWARGDGATQSSREE